MLNETETFSRLVIPRGRNPRLKMESFFKTNAAKQNARIQIVFAKIMMTCQNARLH